MTLVAAFPCNGTPILLGDFLITREGATAGLRKKIHLIHPKLALGWTGHQVAAESVITHLRGLLSHNSPSCELLQDILTSYPASELLPLPVILTGWIIEDNGEAHCFLWNSKWHKEVYYNDHYYVGSGENKFEELTGPAVADTTSSARTPDPVAFTLRLACYLQADEVGHGVNQKSGFGHCYEVIYRCDDEFRYVDEVTYVFAEIWFDSSGGYIGPRLHPVFYKYQTEGEFAVVQISSFDPNTEGSQCNIERHLITPCFRVPSGDADDVAQRLASFGYPMSLESPYACMFASIIKNADSASAEPLTPALFVASPTDPQFRLSFEPTIPSRPTMGVLTVQFPPRELFNLAYNHEVGNF